MDGFNTNRTVSIKNGEEQIFATVAYHFRRTYKHPYTLTAVHVFRLEEIEILSTVSTIRDLSSKDMEEFESAILTEAGKKAVEV